MQKLPIDDVLPLLIQSLHNSPATVVQAPPGAGKTTGIPLALLNASFLAGRKIIMLEPRRLAAVNAARWMAASLGEDVGKTVGYTIRFERKVSSTTRVEVVTEGILARRLQSNPLLEGVGAVIFDEFHERSLQSDLALALCRDAQLGLREDLRIIVMSATLDGEPIAHLLGGAPVITSEGKSFPVEIRYLPVEDNENIAEAAFRAVQQALAETHGDILVFLPGAGEIRRCQRLLEEPANRPGSPLVCPLYGDLPFAAQERAIMPAGRRKVVLATNIAETSLTIEGIGVVIDCGFTRQLRFEPATGLNRLVTVRVSAASAAQRTGRAGRLGPGISYRLWSAHTQNCLIPFAAPEIKSADLTSLALELGQWGVTDATSLAWLDPPPLAALAEGRRLLQRLGALDGSLMITDIGRRMAELPIHPRLAHLLLAADAAGHGFLACDLAALLTERDIFRAALQRAARQVSDSDLLDRLEALADWRRGGRNGEFDVVACMAVDRVAGQLRRLMRINDTATTASSAIVGRLLAWAYPDRIARQREAGANRYLFANGQGGALSRRSSLHGHPYLVAVQVEGGERGEAAIHLASALTLETIRQECVAEITRQRTVAWDDGEGRVVAREEECLGALLLGSRPITPTGDEVRAALVRGILAGPGLAALSWTVHAEQFRARVSFLARYAPEKDWPDVSRKHLAETLEEWLGPYLTGVRSFDGLARVDLLPPLKGLLTWEQLRLLEEGAPTQITVPSGSRVHLNYTEENFPVLAVKLQEMFGLADTPTVAWGRVPVLVHLLSPARRPIQVTSDLKGFWSGAYRDVKKELKGRYPKHPWPDDPWHAVPTGKTKKRMKGE